MKPAGLVVGRRRDRENPQKFSAVNLQNKVPFDVLYNVCIYS